jgi:hypothetical protein
VCAVSFISDHYNQQPWKFTPTGPSNLPNPIPWPNLPASLPWDAQALADLKDILKRLDALDKRLGLAECEDPKKAEWMAAIEARVGKLERRRQPRAKRARP